jgi:hypothetical protein
MRGETHDVNSGGIYFFESRMKDHSAVRSLERVGDQLYSIERTMGDTLLVYLSGIYVFSTFEYYELKGQHRDLNAIVLAGPWQGICSDARAQAVSDHVSLFKLKGFMGALARRDHWNYNGPADD